MHALPVRRIALAISIALTSCASRTALVVVVDTDYAVPAEIDTIAVEVTGPSGTRHDAMQSVGGATDPALPLTLWVVPAGSALGPVTISAAGLHANGEVARQTAVVTLATGATKTLLLFLSRACSGVMCSADQTCRCGTCAPASMASLEDWRGAPTGRNPCAPCERDSDCDDGVACTMDQCESGVCSNVPGSSCTPMPDGSDCDSDAQCVSGHCGAGTCCAPGRSCCTTDAQCPGFPGTAAVCDSPAECQGTRGTVRCDVTSFVCVTESSTPDDSGCAGVMSQMCGAYPAVMCTAMEDQPSDQASRCATSCTGSTDCDPDAYCQGGTCMAERGAGEDCETTLECARGLACVDNVCCSSACNGRCEACNLPTTRGTCTPIPSGADPASECGTVSCSGYFHGWSGGSCYDSADAPDTAVSCDGGGACQDAADVCPYAMGTLRATCEPDCQTPTAGTCMGTTGPSCDNRAPGTTCGPAPSGMCDADDQCNASGVCVPRVASMGTVCRPGTGSCNRSELCDGISTACPPDTFVWVEDYYCDNPVLSPVLANYDAAALAAFGASTAISPALEADCLSHCDATPAARCCYVYYAGGGSATCYYSMDSTISPNPSTFVGRSAGICR